MTRREWRILLVRGQAMARQSITDADFRSGRPEEYRVWNAWLRTDLMATDPLHMRSIMHPFMAPAHPSKTWAPLILTQPRLP